MARSRRGPGVDDGSRRTRGALAGSVVVTVLVIVVAVLALSLALHPSTARVVVPLVTLLVIAVVLLASVPAEVAGGGRVLARSLAGLGAVVLVGLAGYGLVSALAHGDYSAGGPRPTQRVAVAVSSTARLHPQEWVIDDEVTVPPDALLLSATEQQQRRSGWTFAVTTSDPSWRLDHLVDGAYVFVEHRTVVVTSHDLRTTTSSFPVETPSVSLTGTPPAGAPAPGRTPTDGASVRLVARAGSVLDLEAPRGAVLGTTPSTGADEATADRHVRQTAVPLDEDTADVQVSLAGTWLRSPEGAKLYDLTSWPLLPYAFSVVLLAAVTWLRRRIWAWLTAAVKRRRRTGSTQGRPGAHRAAAG